MYLYAITNGPAVKFGISADPESRLASLQSANPEELRLAAQVWKGDNARIEEKLIHAYLWPYRLRGEWFAGSRRVGACVNLMDDSGAMTDLYMGLMEHQLDFEATPLEKHVAAIRWAEYWAGTSDWDRELVWKSKSFYTPEDDPNTEDDYREGTNGYRAKYGEP